MKRLVILALLFASPALAQPPARALFQDDPVTVRGQIIRADTSAPAAKLHIVEEGSGKAWVIEGPSSNTLVRGGVAGATSGVVVVTGYPQKAACAAECSIRMRELTFPDGRKVFLGTSGVTPTL